MTATLRPDEPADRPGLEALAAEIVRDGSVFPFEDVAGVMAYWFSPGARRVVALVDGALVGSYCIKPNHPGRGAHVANAGYMVAEAHRGRGIGRQLGEHSLRAARDAGYLAMQYNQVVATNTGAIALWKSLGFRVIGEVPGAFRHPREGLVGAFVMHRSLA
jgi:GNAT superfamily N-acetyltransferase